MRVTFSFLALCALARAAGLECWGLQLEQRITLTTEEQSHPVCLNVDALPHIADIELVVGAVLPSRVCVSVESIDIRSRRERSFARCMQQEVHIALGSPNVTRSFLFSTSVGMPTPVRIEARPVGIESTPSPPQTPGAPSTGPECEEEEKGVIIECAEDAEALRCDDGSMRAEIRCLEMGLDRVSRQCKVAMHELSQCLIGPQFFVPMEIASIMLLTTASVVLFCSLVRCCCRRFCASAPAPPSEIHLDEPALSDASDDDESRPQAALAASTSAHGRAGAAAAAARAPVGTASDSGASTHQHNQRHGKPLQEGSQGDDDDDDLPAYTSVITQ